MDEVIDIGFQDFEEHVIKSEKPTVVEYWHHKCPACLMMKPIYEQMSKEMGSEMKFTRMNLLDSKESRILAIREGVRSTPTFIIYCGGRPIGVIIGVWEMEEMKTQLKTLLKMSDACLMSTPLESE